MQDSFGRWVKRCRLAMGLTQDVLAERVGCATQTIRKIEGGQRRPSYQMAQRLAQVLELPAEERAAFMQAARASDEKLSPAALHVLPPAVPLRNLPAYQTPFVGRRPEQADLARLLASPDCRLITLLGPGGIGKTRLAVEVAGRCSGFADGVVFVPLAGIGEPQSILAAIADALAFGFSGTTNPAVQLLSYLRDKQLLLVLDNMEHLLGGADLAVDLVGRILAQAPQVKLLVTSRERLRLQPEWAVSIEGLPAPPDDGPQDSEEYPALTLFLNHARRVQHGFRLGQDDYQAVAQICRLVGGMPLGLELAAAWLRVLSPQEISREIMHGLDALPVLPRDLPERHHSLQAVFDHSWRLLSASERHVLRKLALFQGGCTREAAAEIAGASLAVLATLVDKSLLHRTRTGRYDTHALIRQYALARLREDDQEYVAARDRHSAYYATWLKLREPALKGAQMAATLAELSLEIDNIRAAWEWAVARRRLHDIEQSAETLHWFYEFRAWFIEGEAFFRSATEGLSGASTTSAAQAVGLSSDLEHARVLGQVLADHGYMVSRLGDFEQALKLLERSLFLAREYGAGLVQSRVLAYQGLVAYQAGDYHLARQALLESLERARAGADQHTVALCLTWLSMVEHALGAYLDAERAFREALALWRAIGNPRTMLFCITFCSITLHALGKYSEAQTLLQESLALSSATDDRWGKAMALNHLGLIAYGQQQHQEAVRLFREALDLLRTTGTRWELARVLNLLGAALAEIGSLSEAEQAYLEALATATAAQASPDVLQSLTGLATLLTRLQQYETAFKIIVHVQQHAASRIETRTQAARLEETILPQLTRQQIELIRARAAQESPGQLVHVLLQSG